MWSGYRDVLTALHQAGWGIVWTSLYHSVPMFLCVIGWHNLMPGHKRPSLLFMFYILWLRTSVNNLMPVARIGGEIIAVRVMVKNGVRKTVAIASTVVELTTSVLAVFLFNTVGIGLFAFRVSDSNVVWKLIAGLLFSLPLIGAMVAIQKFGFFGTLNKIFKLMIRDKWKHYAGSAAQLDRAVHTMYRRRSQVLSCGFWQFVSWVSGSGEIALALSFLGHPLTLLDCFTLEALIQASSSAAFAVPGALGVQEAGFMLFGHMLGLATDIATALAVIRRCRDMLIFVPGLLAWQIQEGRWILKHSPSQT